MTNVITPNRSANTPSKVQMITLVGVFAAISTILMCFELPLPLMPPFLKVDLSGVPILIMGFLYGPLPAILCHHHQRPDSYASHPDRLRRRAG